MIAMHQEREDYRLTTVEIFFHTVDNPDDLQSLIWEDYDLAPDYPELRRFLTYWSRHIDGIVHSIRVAGNHSQTMPNHSVGAVQDMPSTAIH